jgi:hypothetical protein
MFVRSSARQKLNRPQRRRRILVIEAAFLVSVAELKEICGELTTGRYEYKLFRPNDSTILIRFNDDPKDFMSLNALHFTFSIVVQVPGLAVLHRNPEEALMVCMSIYTANQTQYGFYLDGEGELRKDEQGDWERFWQPLAALLTRDVESHS